MIRNGGATCLVLGIDHLLYQRSLYQFLIYQAGKWLERRESDLRRHRYRFARVFRLEEEPPDDLTDATTIAERVEMVDALSQEAWRLAGVPVSRVDHSQMPMKLVDLERATEDDGAR